MLAPFTDSVVADQNKVTKDLGTNSCLALGHGSSRNVQFNIGYYHKIHGLSLSRL